MAHQADTPPGEASRYLVSDRLVLDRANQTVRLDGEEVALRPTPFNLLALLMSRAGDLVAKEEIFETVWPNLAVSDDVLTTAVRDIRRAIGDSVKASEFIRTAPRRGYVFLPAVAAMDSLDGPPVLSDTPPASGLRRRDLALVSAGAALTLVLILFAAFSAAPDRDATPARLSFILDEPTRLSIDAEAPGFAAAIASLRRHGDVFVASPDEATAALALAWRGDGEIALSFKRDAQAEASYTVPVRIGSSNGDELARRIEAIAWDVARCARQLTPFFGDAASDPVLFSRLVGVCDASRATGHPFERDARSRDLLDAHPDLAGAQALHAVMLATRPPRHIFGQADVQAEGFQREARDLLEEARGDAAAAPLVAFGDAVLAALEADPAERFRALAALSSEGWLGRRSVELRAIAMRQTGRVAEAAYLMEGALEAWPSEWGYRINLAFSLIAQGRIDEAMALLDEGARLTPDASMIVSTRAWLTTLYADDAEVADALTDAAPPHIRDCMRRFTDVRFRGADGLGDLCERLDTVSRARMLARIGDLDGAIALVETFEPGQTGPAMTLFYPEYEPAWRTRRMWDVARRLGLIDIWRSTGTRPDLCYRESIRPLCESEIG